MVPEPKWSPLFSYLPRPFEGALVQLRFNHGEGDTARRSKDRNAPKPFQETWVLSPARVSLVTACGSDQLSSGKRRRADSEELDTLDIFISAGNGAGGRVEGERVAGADGRIISAV